MENHGQRILDPFLERVWMYQRRSYGQSCDHENYACLGMDG